MDTQTYWTILGVVFAVALGVGAPIFGSYIVGRMDFKKKQYEIYFSEKLAAYVDYINLLEEAMDESRRKVFYSNDFSATQARAMLLSTTDAARQIANTSYELMRLCEDGLSPEESTRRCSLFLQSKIDLVDLIRTELPRKDILKSKHYKSKGTERERAKAKNKNKA